MAPTSLPVQDSGDLTATNELPRTGSRRPIRFFRRGPAGPTRLPRGRLTRSVSLSVSETHPDFYFKGQ